MIKSTIKPSALKRQNALLLSDHQESESPLGLGTTILMPFGNRVELDNGGMDTQEKTQLSSMNSKDGSQQQRLTKSLVMRLNAESKLREEQLNSPQNWSSAYRISAQGNGGVKNESSFVLSKEDFLKQYTLIPIVESVMENGITKLKDTTPLENSNSNISKENMFSDIDEEEEFKILEELERELEKERENELKETLLNLK